MKLLQKALNIAIWSYVGVFLGSSVFRWLDFTARPGLYAMESAPWYLSIQLNAVLTALVLALLLTARFFVQRKISPTKASPLSLLSAISAVTGICTAIWMAFDLFGYHPNPKTILPEAALVTALLALSLIFSRIQARREKAS